MLVLGPGGVSFAADVVVVPMQSGTRLATNQTRVIVSPGSFSRPHTTFPDGIAPEIPVKGGTFSRPQSTFSREASTFSRPDSTFHRPESTFSRPASTFS